MPVATDATPAKTRAKNCVGIPIWISLLSIELLDMRKSNRFPRSAHPLFVLYLSFVYFCLQLVVDSDLLRRMGIDHMPTGNKLCGKRCLSGLEIEGATIG